MMRRRPIPTNNECTYLGNFIECILVRYYIISTLNLDDIKTFTQTAGNINDKQVRMNPPHTKKNLIIKTPPFPHRDSVKPLQMG